jgi:hypothetical protein
VSAAHFTSLQIAAEIQALLGAGDEPALEAGDL